MSGCRIALLGLGNLMRTDDAVGMLALQRLRGEDRLPGGVTVVEGGTLGLDLLHPLSGVTHLLALDAIDAGVAPGALLRYTEETISELPAAKSVHLLGFSDLLGALSLTSGAPLAIVVLGVQPEATGWGTQLSRKVAAALPRLVESALAQLAHWSWQTAEPVVRTPLQIVERKLDSAQSFPAGA